MILDNFNPNCDVLLSTTIGVGTFLLFLIPSLILIHFHFREEQRRAQVEGDVYALHLNRPFFTKQRVLCAWVRIALCFTLGLSLLTVHATKNSQLQMTHDYIGPMQVRSVTVRSAETWSTSGLTRRWVVRGFASLRVQWTPGEDAEHQTFSSPICVTHHVFKPCSTIGKPCESRPCAAAEVADEVQRVKECVQGALESYNDKFSLEESFEIRTTRWVAKDAENVPSLPFRGDSETCTIRAGVLVDEEGLYLKILAYFGMASIISGVLFMLIQPLFWYFGYKTFHERQQNGHDGLTECGEDDFSTRSMDEELGKVEGDAVEATIQDSENLHESAGTFESMDLEVRSAAMRGSEESGTTTSQT